MKSGPIILVDDDEDDLMLMTEVFNSLVVKNKVMAFTNGQAVLEYLQTTVEQPFLILCDINLPQMNGLEFKRQLESNEVLRKKSVPFVFLTTTINKNQVAEAYEISVQGFFEKPHSATGLKELLHQIFNYWQSCRHPNN